MQFDVVTIFPRMFEHIFDQGVIGQACQKKILSFRVHNLRDYTHTKHKVVDDAPYGGGGGLIFKIEPLVEALHSIKDKNLKSYSILLSPRGRLFNHKVARELSQYKQLIIFCGRYEGVDERFSEYVDEELSIGDVILSGGEIGAMLVVDAVSRFVSGVIGKEKAPYQDSFEEGCLEHPSYTRPAIFEEKEVPLVLRSGHHGQIQAWRKEQSLNSTLQRRPDLLQKTQRRASRCPRKKIKK